MVLINSEGDKYATYPDDGIDRVSILNWLEALESDKYKQTVGMLVNGNGQGFCCLGVMCKLEGLEVKRAETGDYFDNGTIRLPIINAFFTDKGRELTGTPTIDITEKYGFGDVWENPKYLAIRKYINMNDDGKTFKEIAAALREDYKKVGIL